MGLQTQIKVDLDSIPFMKCYCGEDKFIQVTRLKYISPIQCGDPKGASAQFSMWRCLNCGQFYPGALSASEIEKIEKDAMDKLLDANINLGGS